MSYELASEIRVPKARPLVIQSKFSSPLNTDGRCYAFSPVASHVTAKTSTSLSTLKNKHIMLKGRQKPIVTDLNFLHRFIFFILI
jgi:hypothetical protein